MLSWLNTSAGTFEVPKNVSLKKNIVVRKPAINNTLLNNLVTEEILLQKNNFLNQAFFFLTKTSYSWFLAYALFLFLCQSLRL